MPSPAPRLFDDRLDAADRLLGPLRQALAASPSAVPLILAVPRGAVPMAHRLAQALQTDWDVVLVRKLRAPFSPEVAVGAIAADGWCWIAPWAAQCGADAAHLAQERQVQSKLLQQRQARYNQLRQPVPVAGRVAVVVDDGTATGATLVAALHAVRAQHPAQLLCALPVASTEALARLRPLCDALVCLRQEADFGAVGEYYRHFDAVEDAEVEALLSTQPQSCARQVPSG